MDTYKREYRVTSAEIDMTYHITPNAILLYFQDCVANFLKEHYVAAFDIKKKGMIWVITEFSVNPIGHQPMWADKVTVEIWFGEISSARSYIRYNILDENGDKVADGCSCWVILNMETKKPEIQTGLMAEAGIESAGERCRMRNRLAFESETVYKAVPHKVNMTDLDFNNHVNNRSYLTLAMGTMPPDYISSHELEHMYIRFIHESFLGEELSCKINLSTETEGLMMHSISNEKGEEICNICSLWKESDEKLKEDIAKTVKR